MAEILQREFDKQILAQFVFPELFTDGGVVGRTVPHGMVEGGHIGDHSRYRTVLDMAHQRIVFQQIARKTVEPEALSAFAQFLDRVQCLTSP